MKKLFILCLVLLPIISFAATVGPNVPVYMPDASTEGSCSLSGNLDFKGLIFNFIGPCFLNPIFYLILALSIVTFVYGVFQYMIQTGNDKQQGRDQIVWGLIGIAVLSSIWGLVSIITHTIQ